MTDPPLPLAAWQHAHIAAFLAQYKCAHHADKFRENDITGAVILELGQDELRELGVTKVGERVRLLSGIKELKRRAGAAVAGAVAASPALAVDLRRAQTTTTRYPTRASPIEVQLNGQTTPIDGSLLTTYHESPALARTSGTIKRLNASRPPPLDLHQTSHTSLSPRNAHRDPSSSATPRGRPDTSPSHSSSVPAPQQPTPSRRLRAAAPAVSPPSSNNDPSPAAVLALSASRRSPSPIPRHAREFIDRPLPARPGEAAHRPGITRAASTTGSHGRMLSLGTTGTATATATATATGLRPGSSGSGGAHSPPGTGSVRGRVAAASPAQEYAQQQQQMAAAAASSRPGKLTERSQTAQVLSLDAVRRRCVKFILADDASTRVVDLERCTDGCEVMEKVLKKFGKAGPGGVGVGAVSGSEEEEEDEGGDTRGERTLIVDGWAVFAPSGDDPLTESQLMSICQSSLDDPARARGLTLRKVRKIGHRKDIEGFFGEALPSKGSPTEPGLYLAVPAQQQQQRKKTNRASMSSVMSALGVTLGQAALPPPHSSPSPPQPPPPAATKSPSSGSFLASRGKKMYNFFGHRPPSELISTHLADYFPAAKRKDLERGYRNSMLRIGGAAAGTGPAAMGDSNRASYASSRTSSVEQNVLPSRFSVASSASSSAEGGSARGRRTSPPTLAPADVPRVSISNDTHASDDATTTTTTGGGPHARPASIFSTASRRRRRKSHIPPRDRRQSATPSMLTVDEITAEFEHRRASVITFAESEQEAEEAANRFSSGVGTAAAAAAVGPGGLPPQPESEEEWDEESYEESEEESEEEESEEESEEDEEEVEDEHGKAFTSTGDKRSIKWIKGALIGAGSFGQVYLGMDAHTGLLMAVKQVDLSVGVQNEDKKQSMMTALQREIALLRELQHENIVQYLDSSADEKHLNIFLEYVPGGSVAALLRNYGAFEEALVKNFVRQILTGLEYLHDKGIVHRDIKGANILVDNKGGVKISDFGISKKVENNLLSTMRLNRPSLQGSVFWMAPEVVKQTAYTKKADIWSVGCLVIEMLTGEHPWPDLTQMQAIFRIGQMSQPTIPADISADAVAMLQQTFEIDHHARPDASDLLACAWLAKVG